MKNNLFLMRLLLRILLNALAVIIVARVVPGISIAGYIPAIFAGLSIAVVNSVLRPILHILMLPFSILTLGFFELVVNGWMFWFVARFVPGFEVAGFWPAFWGAIVFLLVSLITNAFLGSEEGK